jgi:N-acetylneuraminate synthase
MEPQELQQLREETERAWQAVGQVSYGPTSAEMKSLAFRRSLYIAQDLQAGELLTRENLRCVRPGFGLAPKHLDSLLGLRVGQAVKAGTPMAWSLLGEGPAA